MRARLTLALTMLLLPPLTVAAAPALAQTIDLPADGALGQSGVAVVAVDERGAVLRALALPLRDGGG